MPDQLKKRQYRIYSTRIYTDVLISKEVSFLYNLKLQVQIEHL